MSRLLASPSGGQTWSRSDCVSATAVVAVLPLWDADLYPFVFQRFSIPIGIATPVRQEPFGLWKVPPPGGSAHVVADLACRDEDLQGPPLGVCHGMKLGVQPAPLRGELIPRSNSSSPPHPPDCPAKPSLSLPCSRPCGGLSDKSRRSSLSSARQLSRPDPP